MIPTFRASQGEATNRYRTSREPRGLRKRKRACYKRRLGSKPTNERTAGMTKTQQPITIFPASSPAISASKPVKSMQRYKGLDDLLRHLLNLIHLFYRRSPQTKSSSLRALTHPHPPHFDSRLYRQFALFIASSSLPWRKATKGLHIYAQLIRIILNKICNAYKHRKWSEYTYVNSKPRLKMNLLVERQIKLKIWMIKISMLMWVFYQNKNWLNDLTHVRSASGYNEVC